MPRLSRVLVTGGAGFIGSEVVRRLLATRQVERLVVLDAFTYAGDAARLNDVVHDPRLVVVRGNILDGPLVRRCLDDEALSVVLHLAAESHVDRSIADAAPFLQTNVLGTASLLEAALQVWGPEQGWFHHVSTDEVYGDLPPAAPASRVGDPYRPSSPYAASKASSDHLVKAWARTHGLRTSLSSGSNTYGPWQDPEKLIPRMIHEALAGRPLPVFGDGQQRRDWLHVTDHAEGILRCVEAGTPGGHYHLGGDNERPNLEVVHGICSALDGLKAAGAPFGTRISHVADRPGHDRRYALNIDETRTQLGWSPTVDWKIGLADTVAWYAARL